MQNYLKIMLLPFVFFVASKNTEQHGNTPIPLPVSIGDSLLNLVQKSDSVQAFLLQTKPDSTNFTGFTVLDTMLLDSVQTKQLKTLFRKPKNFLKTTDIKRCEFRPTLAFRLHPTDSTTTDILLDFSCDVLHLAKTGFNFDPSHAGFVSLLDAVFPDRDERTQIWQKPSSSF